MEALDSMNWFLSLLVVLGGITLVFLFLSLIYAFTSSIEWFKTVNEMVKEHEHLKYQETLHRDDPQAWHESYRAHTIKESEGKENE